VCDNGPGIPDEEKLKVFDRFVRLDATRQMSTGAGLGLAISKWAVELHQGAIQLEDNLPSGCCLIVEIPLNPEHWRPEQGEFL
jgi:signal transduction histidine kinase